VRAILISACVFVFGVATARAEQGRTQQGQKISDPNVQKVLQQIHEVNQMEIEAARMAEKKAVSDDVREFAKDLREQHADLDKRVMDMAKKKGVQLQTGNIDHGNMQDLGNVTGVQFDQQFLASMLDGHSEAIKDFSRIPMDVHDEDVEKLVDDALPQLHEHYQKASTTLAKLGMESEQKKLNEQKKERRNPQGG
jgi:putative membrane protein